MAFRPCVSCRRGFFGGSVFSYVTWYVGEERTRVRMVQCGECASEMRNGLLDVGDAWVGEDWQPSPNAPLAPLAGRAAYGSAAGREPAQSPTAMSPRRKPDTEDGRRAPSAAGGAA